jgi:hypothetical protein
MNEYNWVSLISLSAFLILALSAYRAHNVGGRKTLVMLLAWGSIFMLVTLAASWVTG